MSASRSDGADGPCYELLATGVSGGRLRLEIMQLPSHATPRLRQVERVAGIAGRAFDAVEGRVLRRLRREGVRLPDLPRGERWRYALAEDAALVLALLFRTVAPMHNSERIRIVAAGIDAMSREEAGYWLGMAIHRRHPRRVLAALRMLMTSA